MAEYWCISRNAIICAYDSLPLFFNLVIPLGSSLVIFLCMRSHSRLSVLVDNSQNIWRQRFESFIRCRLDYWNALLAVTADIQTMVYSFLLEETVSTLHTRAFPRSQLVQGLLVCTQRLCADCVAAGCNLTPLSENGPADCIAGVVGLEC